MYEKSMMHQFSLVFVKAIKGEMESMKKRLGSFELPVKYISKKNDFHEFSLYTPSDKLTRAMQCTLRTESKDYSVEIVQIDGTKCLLSGLSMTLFKKDSSASLVIYPWFLYEKLITGIENLPNSQNDKGIDLALKAFGIQKALVEREKGIKAINLGLNESQKEAVAYSLASEVSFIWGPPGTGKTYTLAQLLNEFIMRGKRVLVTSTTNGAVDTVIEKIISLDLAKQTRLQGEMARLGRPHEELSEVNIDTILNRINTGLIEEIEKLREKQTRIYRSISDLKEFLLILEEADDQIDLFGASKSSVRETDLKRSLTPLLPETFLEKSASAKSSIISTLLEEKEKTYQKGERELADLNKKRIRDPKAVVSRSRLLFSTLASLYTGNMLEGEQFDVVVVEEAGMAVLPALFYSLTRARERVVLVGDPMQLPSVVQSNDPYVKKALGRSIYQVGLKDDLSDKTVHLLNTQYRMHPQIGELISHLFYGGRLNNGVKAEERRSLAALEPAPGDSVCRVDLGGISVCERKEGSPSRFNRVSAQTCLTILKGIPPEYTVALITPYAEQSRLLNSMIHSDLKESKHIECSTIHRFQGQERDVVILDLTDSEPLKPGILVTGEFGRNLLNVALSRARGKLIVVSERAYFLEKAQGSAVQILLDYKAP